MPYVTKQFEYYMQETQPVEDYNMVTIGTVVDTNDPQQMGRVRVVCPVLGESVSALLDDIPWAIYVSPFGGTVATGNRGPDATEVGLDGSVTYGLWNIPKVGSQVLVMFIDGNQNYRAYFGCVFDVLRPHTMPHGRWFYDDHPALERTGDPPRPFGPYTSREQYIEPLAGNMAEAFPKGEPNYEWRNRAADYTVAGIDVFDLNVTDSTVPDDKDVSWDDWISTQGYNISRQNPDAKGLFNEGNLDNMVSSWTTPGFHAISMDDREKNERIRIRTTAGHQIILDDTNERIYVSTAKGKNWIEIDQEGNIDIYTDNKVNVRAKQGINFTSDKTIRMYAKEGIHMYSEQEIRMQAKQDVHFKFEQNWRTNTSQGVYHQSGQNTNIKAGQSIMIEAAQAFNAKSGSEIKLTSGSTTNVKAGGDILMTASPNIHLNGPGAATASSAEAPNEQKAMWTSRVPDHEPWARVMTKDDYTHAPEFEYTSKQVNRNERGQEIPRGKHWRR